MNKLSQIVFLLVAVVMFVPSLVSADWTAPSNNPPVCNSLLNPGCSLPLNVSTTTQTKGAGLNLLGRLGLGKINPTQTIDMAATGTYGINSRIIAQASTTINNYFFGMAGNQTMSGTNNAALGFTALDSNTTGSSNSGFGAFSLTANTIGSRNTAFGYSTLSANTSGSNNAASGAYTLAANTSGSQNTGFGFATLYGLTTGTYNTALGYQAGRYLANGTTLLTTPSNSIFIGANAKGKTVSDTNEIVIGMNANGLGSNSVILGNDSILTTALKGNVGVGTVAPAAKLDVSGKTKTTSLQVGASSVVGQVLTAVDTAGNATWQNISGSNNGPSFGSCKQYQCYGRKRAGATTWDDKTCYDTTNNAEPSAPPYIAFPGTGISMTPGELSFEYGLDSLSKDGVVVDYWSVGKATCPALKVLVSSSITCAGVDVNGNVSYGHPGGVMRNTSKTVSGVCDFKDRRFMIINMTCCPS